MLSGAGYAQTVEDLLPKIAAEKNDSARFYLAFSTLTVSETNPVLDMHNADVLLVHGQMTGDKVSQTLGLLCLGYDYRVFGSTAKALEYNIKGVAVAEETGAHAHQHPRRHTVRLLGLALAGGAVVLGATLLHAGLDKDGWALAARHTARFSVLWFLTAFAAGPLARITRRCLLTPSKSRFTTAATSLADIARPPASI